MARRGCRQSLFELLESKRVRGKLHPRVPRRMREEADGSPKRLRRDEFTADGFPWGCRNMEDML